MIPGSNILNTALQVIAKQPFNYYAFASRVGNKIGQYLINYAPPVPLLGSVQAVGRDLYQNMGLHFDKYYLNFFVSQDVIDVSRDVSGDLMQFEGNMYQCQSIAPWFAIDGWVQILAVQVQNIPLIISNTAPAPGTYNTSDHLNFSVTYNQAVNVTGTPYIALTPVAGVIGGNAAYTGGSGTTTLTFSYVVTSGDTAAGIIASSPVQGLIVNAAASAAAIPANSTFIPPDLTGIILN